MVVDTLANHARYLSLNPHFAKAFEFLCQADLASLEAGKHPVDGDSVYAIVSLEPGRGHGGAKREVHRRYIDIQFCVEGTDQIGYKPTSACRQHVAEYNPDKDVELFGDEPDTWVLVPPGSFLIAWPEDTHAPLGAQGPLHKVIVKVAVD